MGTSWAHMGTSIVASFLASLVECVEALTVVLAVGSVRGWRSALTGSATAIAVLLIIIAALGTALAQIPLPIVQLAVGTLLLLFGLRWLRKAILRSAGQIPFHDERAVQDEAEGDDGEEGGDGSQAGREEHSCVACSDGDDDEDDLSAFEHGDVEGGCKCDLVPCGGAGAKTMHRLGAF